MLSVFAMVLRPNIAGLHGRENAYRQLAAAGLLLLFILPVELAHADCQPAVPANGGTVNCTGTQNSAYTVSDLGSLTIYAQANFNAAFQASRIGSLAMTSTNSNFQDTSFIDIGSLELALSGGNFNGALSISKTPALTFSSVRVTSTTNLQATTFAGIDDLTLTLNGGNVNGTITVDQGGSATIINRINANAFVLDLSDSLDFRNFGTVNQGIRLTGNGDAQISNASAATVNNGISSTGSSKDTIDNSGTIQGGTVDLGAGDDVLVNRAGVINSDVFLGSGNDSFFVLGGLLRRIDGGAGDDQASIEGGTIDDYYRAQGGNDVLLWSGGTVRNIDMGADTDLVTMRNLPASAVANGTLTSVVGGLGANDHLVFDNVQTGGQDRFREWELFDLTNASALTMSGNIVMGDSGTGTGTLSIDSTSTLFAGANQSAVVPFTGSQLVTVNNSGSIDLTNGGGAVGDSLTIAGNYVGSGGSLHLNTFLEMDGSPSDLLVIDGGTATGNTNLIVSNAGGPGAVTAGDGILVVNTTNGGTTSPGAFVAGAPIVGGPYEYTLERGSVSGGNAQAWFLRSALDCALVPSLRSCVGPQPPEPSPSPPTPHYRPQVSLYTAIPPMAAIYGRHLIGTLHERVGEEEQLNGRLGADPNFDGAWSRVIGQWGHADGDALGIYRGGPQYDYGFGAMQLGIDVYSKEYDNGARDNAGLYAAFGHGSVDVSHNLLERSFDAGSNDFNAFTAGGYWTRFWENNAYLDFVVQGTWYDVTSTSQRNTLLSFPDQDVDGFGFAASLEGGYPFYFGDGWQLEPQAQMIYQAINFDSLNDGAADVRFDDTSSLPSRVGVRLARTWAVEEVSGQTPARLATVWGRLNLWHNFLNSEVTTSFSSASGFIPFTAELEDSWIEADFGGTVEISPTTSVYGNLDLATSFDGDAYSIGGKVGLRMKW